MKQYTVTGMSCAACSNRVENAVKHIDGVTSVSVNLLTSSMLVEGNVSDLVITEAVKNAGYTAFSQTPAKAQSDNSFLEDTQTPKLKKRLLQSVIFLVVLMYFSMGHTMFGLPLPGFFEGNPIASAMVQMLLTIAVMIINKTFFVNGFKSFVNRAPNMDALVALGSGTSFVYSTYILFAMTASTHPQHMLHDLYFESAAMILTLITVGKMLEAHSKGKTTNALKSLINLTPKTAVIVENGVQKEIPAEQISPGDIFAVKPGTSIPADGIIIEGHCAIDESALTGESIPIDKTVGSTVSAATINISGYILCRAEKTGENTTLAQIIKTVKESAASKAPIAKIADKVSGIFVPAVIVISIITALIWLALGYNTGFALTKAISVLVISCPCALGLATPVAIMVGSGVGAKHGILFKNAVSLEETGRIKTVAFDKTGTITKGLPVVTDIIPVNSFTEKELMEYAYSIELKSEHPLAKAIIKKGEEMSITKMSTESFDIFPGNGIKAVISNETVVGGNINFTNPDNKTKETANALAESGKTPLIFKKGNTTLGVIAVADEIKKDSASAIEELKNMGIKVVMITGDNKKTAAAVKDICGIDEVFAEVLPKDKENVIKKLKLKSKTAMVGDGINDAPALTSADMGIAVGSGTDVAIDAAQIVITGNRLSDVPAAIRLSRKTLKIIYENLFWAFIYNVIGIPLAAGVFTPLGLQLNPMFGAAAMSLSSFCVVTNALRLNGFNIQNNKKHKQNKKEKKTMKKELKIEGMMCPHCSGRVQAALQQLDGVESATASHETGTAVVTLTKEIPTDILKSTVESQGYKVID